MPKKPSCSDFIVAAIRATRPGRKGLKQGTAVSKGLRFIFSLAKEFYSEWEFRRSLRVLIRDRVVLLIAEIREVKGEHPAHVFFSLRKVLDVPLSAPLDDSGWCLNAKGKTVDSRKEKNYTFFWRPRLFVIADGLPASIAKVATDTGTTKGAQIMESLQKRKKK